ncbi:hypothetical protein BSL78_26883 [Apostichopus japonicus]|uniref:EGF-like domain-containing protein n=1 Tax=Stichopus japonicus TaxID=307972 RepID=A0A2G8JKM2_STIJA|nr:hypothetical protein BSL78_26883 [Apostichopus japonicus]
MVGEACADILECNNPGTCPGANRQCTELIGSFRCDCVDGYAEFNGECQDVDECNDVNICNHDPVSSCVNSVGSYSCDCVQGYAKNAVDICIDIDECQSGQNPCDLSKRETCENTAGSFTCNCLEGHFRENRNEACIGIDECMSSPCTSQLQVCVDGDSGFTCVCREGYIIINGICQNENECINTVFPCDSVTEDCRDIEGTFACDCKDGYTRNSNNVCDNINECEQDSLLCSGGNEFCVDTQGSYRCDCIQDHVRSAAGTCNPFLEILLRIIELNGATATFEETLSPMRSTAINGTVCNVMFSIVSTRFPSAIGCNVAKFQRGSLIAHVTILLDDLGLSQNEVRTYLYSQLNDGRYVSGDALDSLVVDNSTTAVTTVRESCTTLSCANGGVCDTVPELLSVACTCGPTFEGIRCQTPIITPQLPSEAEPLDTIVIVLIAAGGFVFVPDYMLHSVHRGVYKEAESRPSPREPLG